MSLIGSLLGLVLIPLKAKPREQPKEVDNLAVMALADEVRRLQFALDFWRESGVALMEENKRLRDENERLVLQNRSLGAERNRLRTAYEGQQMAQAGQSYQGLGQLDMTSPNYHAALQSYGCTCVPARAEALKR